MGPIKAVVSAYANMLNFTGRARRAEYWWFMLWICLAGAALGGGIAYYVMTHPEFIAQTSGAGKDLAGGQVFVLQLIQDYQWHYFAVNLIMFWIPTLSATIRRLHDTDRSGWWYFIQLVPLIGVIWFIVLMCLPGSHGNNRFGGDPIANRKAKEPAHPAFANELQGEERDRAEVARRAAARDYYKRRVLPSIQKA